MSRKLQSRRSPPRARFTARDSGPGQWKSSRVEQQGTGVSDKNNRKPGIQYVLQLWHP